VAHEGIYRDPLVAVRARYDERRIEVEDRRARVTDLLVACLPSPLARRLEACERDAMDARPGESLEEIARAEQAFARWRDALDEAIALAPDIDRALRAVPDEPPMPPAFEGGRGVFITHLRCSLETILAARDHEATIEDDGASVVARFTSRGTRFALRAGIDPVIGDGWCALATSVARALGPLELRPETWGHTFTKALHLDRDVETGDEAFDTLFLVDADAETVRAVLGEGVRAALLELAHYDVPRVRVRDGSASIEWRFEPAAPAIDAAARALGWMRSARFDVALLRSNGGAR
jgi:hypothetical protein